MLRLLGAVIAISIATIASALPVIPPNCPNPAPYHPAPVDPGEVCPAQGHIVLFSNSTDAVTATHEIEQQCGFSGSEIFSSALQAFSKIVTPAQIACIRCDPRVVVVEENFEVRDGLGPPLVCAAAAPAQIPALSTSMQVALAGALAAAGMFAVARMR